MIRSDYAQTNELNKLESQDNMPEVSERKENAITINTKDLPPEMLFKIKEYAVKLRKKYPKMKPSRMERRLAEKFNLKIV